MKKQVTYSLNILLFLLILFPSISHSLEKDYTLEETRFNYRSEVAISTLMEIHSEQNNKKGSYIVRGERS